MSVARGFVDADESCLVVFGSCVDTAFMYMIGCLIMIKLYQTRHPDVNAHAHTAYCFIALIVFMGVMGVVCHSFLSRLILLMIAHLTSII